MKLCWSMHGRLRSHPGPEMKIIFLYLFTLFLVSCEGTSGTKELCGNGFLDPGEHCDGTIFRYSDCVEAGFDSGTLACNKDCTIDFSQCSPFSELCGNGIIESNEDCDIYLPVGTDCTDFGYQSGTLTCQPSCRFDISQCEGLCPEECIEGEKICAENSINLCTATSDCNEWVVHENCSIQSSICIDDGYGNAICASGCQYPCENEGETICSDDNLSVKTCIYNETSDCYGWTFESCGDFQCIISGTLAMCETPCITECDLELDNLRCRNEKVQICSEIEAGCFRWADYYDCGLPSICNPSDFSCMSQGSGSDCSDPLYINYYPSIWSGSNFNEDFTGDSTLVGTNCPEGTTGSAGWIAIWTNPQDILVVSSTGEHPVQMSFLTECNGNCSDSGSDSVIFHPSVEGWVFLHAESWSSVYSSPWEIQIKTASVLTTGDECHVNSTEVICPLNDVCITDVSSSTSYRCHPITGGGVCDESIEVSEGIIESFFQGHIDTFNSGIYTDSSVDIFFSFTPSEDATYLIFLDDLDFHSNLYLAYDCEDASSIITSDQNNNIVETTAFLNSGVPISIIVEKTNPAWIPENPYSFKLKIMKILSTESTTCGDQLDNDLDGLVDCDDPDCFGILPFCSQESNCSDSMDNDGDGQADCLDSDCILNEVCVEKHGYWEQFTQDSSPVDLEGKRITYEPTGLFSYTVSVTQDATLFATGLPVDSFAVADDFIYTAYLPFDFTFFGFSYNQVYISSNGFISFDPIPDSIPFESDLNLFSRPVIAAMWDDLTRISYGDEFTIHEGVDSILGEYWAFTWRCREYNSVSNILYAQIVLFSSGIIRVDYVENSISDGIAGISFPGGGEIPSPVNFVP